jgi:iron complex outermembrane receptor protein
MKHTQSLLLLLAGVIPTQLSHGQSPAASATTTTELPTVTVTATPESLTVPTIAQAEQELALVTGGAGVVNAEDYKKGRAVTLKDALDFATGVFTQPRFGAEEARISVRGSGIQRTFHGRGLKVLQDGVPINLADGGFDMQSIEPLAADYIEVYRGANALRYGSTTLGGAINFVSPTGYTAPAFQGRFEYGSFNTFRGQLSAADVLGNLDYYATVTHYSTEGFRDHSDQSTQRFFSNVGYKFSEDVETRFFLTYVHTDSELPGNLTKEELRNHPDRAQRNAFSKQFDYIDSDWQRNFELFRIANRTTWNLGEDQQLSLSSFYAYKDLDHPILFVIDQVSHDFGFDLNYLNKTDLGGHKNQFIAGISPTFGLLDDVRFANVLGERGAKFAQNYQQSTNVDFYIEDLYYLTDRFAVSVGGQISYARRDNEDRFPVSATNPDNSDVQDWWGYSPKVGLLYELTESAQLFFNASRSFEPPSFGELSNSALGGAGLVDLEAQTATTVEIGTRGKSANNRVKWDIAYYFSWIDNEMLELSVAPGLTQTVNAGRTIHQGVELGLDVTLLEGIFARGTVAPAPALASAKGAKAVQPVAAPAPQDRLVFRQNYLYNGFRFDNDKEFGDNQLAGMPEHYYRAELVYEHPSGFYLGPNLEWVFSDYSVDFAGTLSADSYAILGFKVGYRTAKGLSFYVDARNLTDEHYAATTGVINRAGAFNQAQFLPGDGRSFFFGVEYKF